MNEKLKNRIGILIVDDEETIRNLLREVIQKDDHLCFLAANGEEALAALETEDVDVVITDITMPKMDGIALTEKIKARYDQDIIMMTGNVNNVTYRDAIAIGCSDFIQKPFDIQEVSIRLKRVLRERSMRAELNRALHESEKMLEGMIHTLSSTVEARDPYTSGHQIRVAELACAIARELKLPEDRITAIRMAGVIHDIGKIAIPGEILSKPSRLLKVEFQLLKIHPKVGYDILKNSNFPLPLADIVYQHHEKIDGSGYPKGLAGKEILLEARIMTVADVVESMSSHRPYRPALGIDATLETISENRGTLFDPDVVDACLKVIRKEGFTFKG